MEKRFSFFSIAALAFALVLVFGVPTGAKAASSMNQQSTSSSSWDRDKAAQDSSMPGSSMSETGQMGQHSGTMSTPEADKDAAGYGSKSLSDKDKSWKEKNQSSRDMEKSENLTSEQQKELSSMSKEHKQMFDKLSANEKQEFFKLSSQERDKFFTLKPQERETFWTLHPQERTVFLNLQPQERLVIQNLKPEERHEFFSLRTDERQKFFSAKPEERHRILSRAESKGSMTGRDVEKGEMSSKDTDVRSKDTDRSRMMKSDEGMMKSDEGAMSHDNMQKKGMSGSERDKGMSDKDISGKTRQDMDFNQRDQTHRQDFNAPDKDTSSSTPNMGSKY